MEYFYLVNLKKTLECREIYYWTRTEGVYTVFINEAGKFLYEDAIGICENDADNLTTIIPIN